MGLILEKYSNNMVNLHTAFLGNENNENYYAGDSIQGAINYFNLYFKDNQLYIHTEEELITEETGISSLAEATQLRQELNSITSNLTDEQAMEKTILFATWKINTNYIVGDRVRYGGRLFKVLQSHTSQEDWTPSRAPSLFAEMLTSEDGEPQEWQQPSSTNPYLTGDKVIFNGNVYESLIDYNVWSPTESPGNWRLIEDEEDTPAISEWQQPDAGNPYMIGDRVLFNGHTYESAIDNNVWSPEAYPAGWTLIE